jgi:hypothetical protein
MSVLLVNGVDFSDIIVRRGYKFTTERLHADGSGRNPNDGLMEFVIVAKKWHLDITAREGVDPDRVAQFVAAMEDNGTVNQYSAYNTGRNSMVSFVGYINDVSIGLIESTLAGRIRLDSFPIKIVEM